MGYVSKREVALENLKDAIRRRAESHTKSHSMAIVHTDDPDVPLFPKVGQQYIRPILPYQRYNRPYLPYSEPIQSLPTHREVIENMRRGGAYPDKVKSPANADAECMLRNLTRPTEERWNYASSSVPRYRWVPYWTRRVLPVLWIVV